MNETTTLFLQELLADIKNEIREKGYSRKKFATMLKNYFDLKRKNYDILAEFDQLLLENELLVYTKSENIRNEKENWEWEDVKNNQVYISFISSKNQLEKASNKILFKMNVMNESAPTEKLFTLYAAKSKEILICSAYVDEQMATLLADIAKRNKIKVRFLADINFNSNVYKRGIIRSKIETVGTFRTLAGTQEEQGIMHLKLYVFYLNDKEVVVFNTSANFTAAAWKFINHEAPVTIQTGNTQNTQIAILVNAAESLWKKSENNQSMKKFNVGDKVSHLRFGIGEIFKIIGENARVIFDESGLQVVKISELELIINPLQMIEEGENGSIYRTKAKFLAYYIYAQNNLTNEFYDFRIKPVPHQLLALKKAITSPKGGNLLFADDVGLGKTIEAGLVIQNLIRRIGEDKARILIMCPAGLRWQWYEEMKDKFGLSFNIWKEHSVKGAEAFSGSLHGQNRLIASYHGMVVGDTEEAILRVIEKYDLVVIDECHKFSNESTQWWQLTKDMRTNSKVGQLLLLSATPHSGDRNRFLNLLHLLDDKTFPKGNSTQDSLQKITEPAMVADYVYRNDKLSVTDFDGKPLFRNITTESVDVRLTNEEHSFCELVVDYIVALDEERQKLKGDKKTQVGFVISVYRKMLASSWKNVFRSIQARYKYLLNQALEEEGQNPLFDEEEEIDEREERQIMNLIKEMKSQRILSNEMEYLEKIVESGRKLEKKNVDTKIQRLMEVVNKPELANQKVIIFTQYVKTLEVIKKALGGKEYVAEIQGSIDMDNRIIQVDKFRNRTRFMVCTEAGGEGINLQFANIIINFDMPWNPSRLQQRIGRAWRYGQEKEVKCFNFFVTNSISDQRVLERLNVKLMEMVRNFLIPLEFNGVKPELHDALIYDTTMRVLGKAQEYESFESIMGILNEHLREERIKEAEKRIAEALQFVQIEQKDLAPNVGMQLDEIKGFYAPRSINFLHQFAFAIAKTFGGELKPHADGTYEFINLNLTEIGQANTLFSNKKYVFEQGRAGKKEHEMIYFFGFGDDFFNHLMEVVRNQSFGGLVAYANIQFPFNLDAQAIALVAATATSVASENERSENYNISTFISVPSGKEINVEHLFGEEWSETPAAPQLIANSDLNKQIQQVFEQKANNLKAFRNKDFILTTPIIEAAVSVAE